MIFEKWYSWPFGILAVVLYGISCYHYKIYGEMSLQVIYVVLAIFGFYKWKIKSSDSLSVSQLRLSALLAYLSFAVVLCGITFFILKKLQGELPVLDAITNGFAIVATYLAAKKKIENWFIWIPVNALTVYMMIDRGMSFYAVLYLAYGLFAILGYIQWKKSMNISRTLHE